MFDHALTNFNAGLYDDALLDLKRAKDADAKFIEAYFLTGEIYFTQKKYPEAIQSFKDGLAIDPKGEPKAYLSLAKIEQARGFFTDAISHFKEYLSFPDIKPAFKTAAEKGITQCEFALNLMAHPVPYKPENLGPEINTTNSEYALYLTVDEKTAVYSITRPADANTVGVNRGVKVEEDIYTSQLKDGKWTKGVPMSGGINSHDNEGSECISPDGNYLFFTGCQRPDGLGSCDLYVATRKGNTWSEPFNLGEGANSNKWDTHASFSSDGHTLYFTSNRPGGQGKADIWKVTLDSTGVFGNPENLGPEINTPEDEFTPFIHPDGKSLYFASKGHLGMGGFDLFLSRKGDDGKWQKPQNLGYPINSIDDELSLFVASCSGKAYISSDKDGGFGQKDIYSFDLYADVAPARVTYIKGVITDNATKAPLGAIAHLYDLKNGQEVASAQADPKTGGYTVCLPSGGDYALQIANNGYLFYSANFSLPPNSECKPYSLNAALSPVVAGEVMVLRNVFFDVDKYDLKPQSTVELDKLADFLNKNPNIKIEIGGHTDSDGDDARNLTLSDSRAKAVMSYLITKGISTNRLSAKGYGETAPLAKNDTPENKALNRRVEVKVK